MRKILIVLAGMAAFAFVAGTVQAGPSAAQTAAGSSSMDGDIAAVLGSK